MKESGNLGTHLEIQLPHDSTGRLMETIRIPLQFLGILKTSLCRSAEEQVGTPAPVAKSYGYL